MNHAIIIYGAYTPITRDHQHISVEGAQPIWIRTQLVNAGIDGALDQALLNALPGETVLNTIPAEATDRLKLVRVDA